jgi:hypothetical protein
MATFAQLDENNIVINVIVAEQEYIDSGALGDPLKWIECCLENSIRQRYPGMGYSYHTELDEFIPPKPDSNPSFVWNGKPGLQGWWVPPIPHPGTPENGIEADWNESLCRWDIKQRPIPYPVNDEGRRYRWNDEIQNWEEGPVTPG